MKVAAVTPLARYTIIFAIAAPASAATWLIFHAVFESLTLSEQAMGYVDPLTKMGIDLGYVAMVGGTLVFAGIALWAGVKALRTWRRGKE